MKATTLKRRKDGIVTTPDPNPKIRFTKDSQGLTAFVSGEWKIKNLKALPRRKLTPRLDDPTITMDGTELKALDTAGASSLLYHIGGADGQKPELRLVNFESSFRNILDLVISVAQKRDSETLTAAPSRVGILRLIGRGTWNLAAAFWDMLSFLGKSIWLLSADLILPWRFRIKELFVQLEHAFVRAIPVCVLVTFMIGIVVSFITAEQIKKYGANLFIVDGISLAMLRELSPVVISIIVAGRSGSAFTAQLGTMKMNEETDAIVTLGLSTLRVLVLPRLLALLISVPLLVFIGDVTGIIAGMIIANTQLDLSTVTFFRAFSKCDSVKVGVAWTLKAPIFAVVIGLISCRNGLRSGNDARSVGLSTTATVVQSIVAVIILDALFAVIFQELQI